MTCNPNNPTSTPTTESNRTGCGFFYDQVTRDLRRLGFYVKWRDGANPGTTTILAHFRVPGASEAGCVPQHFDDWTISEMADAARLAAIDSTVRRVKDAADRFIVENI